MKKLAVLAMAGLMSVTASAVNWVQYHQDNSGTDYVDTDSITSINLDSSKSHKQAFLKTDYNEPQKAGSDVYTSMFKFKQFDCKSNPRKSRMTSVLIRNGSNVIGSQNYSNPDWSIHYPETIGETSANFVCSYRK